MKTSFYLARHGQTEWNAIKKLQGRLDSPLTDEGKAQAAMLAEQVKSAKLDSIFCSPLPRAHKCALICQQQLQIPLTIEPQLIERDFGLWQGQLFDDVRTQPNFEDIFFRVTRKAPPEGETGIDCAERFAHALETIANNQPKPNNKILVITHGDVLRCFCAELNQKSFCDAYSQYGNAKLFIVDYCHKNNKFSV